MKKTSFLMLAAGSLAMLAAARPVLRRYGELNRRAVNTQAGSASGHPAVFSPEDMQPVAQESSMVAEGAQQHEPAGAAPVQAAPVPAAARKDGDFAPPVGA
ncbi:hypothetical protein HBDW_40370 [Herbaspirillum sp. DW155]|uniref:hypothetical protein n=1 Tax=Herbaspirillum sp. DW155 TaxID=3095609 RepID=UPI003090D0FD|nr:hypothetical protein HBDW_40370 [Herbaspirillum sp. DW155]